MTYWLEGPNTEYVIELTELDAILSWKCVFCLTYEGMKVVPTQLLSFTLMFIFFIKFQNVKNV